MVVHCPDSPLPKTMAGRYSPTQGHLAVSPPEILKIICCRCKKDCSGKQCGCKRLGLHCTEECGSGRHRSARTSTYALETIRQKTKNQMSLTRNNTFKIKQPRSQRGGGGGGGGWNLLTSLPSPLKY